MIDRPGSMARPKLATTKSCAAYLVRRLAPTDDLAVVTHDDRVDLVAPLAPVHGDALLAALDAIGPGVDQPVWWAAEGLGASASPPARTTASPDPTTRQVLLLTDGQANVGVTNQGVLVGIVMTARAEGIGMTTIGLGTTSRGGADCHG